jgi:thiamine monophosphate synthase
MGFEAGDIGDGYMAETIGAKGCPVGQPSMRKLQARDSVASQLRIGTLSPVL